MNVNELTIELINSIKATFKNKNITVAEAPDETEYLLSSPANKEHLEKSIRELQEGKGTDFTLQELQSTWIL